MKIMKKRLLYLFMLICSVSLFTSCGDDDDDVKYPVDSELAGAYKGTMDVYYVGVSTPMLLIWFRKFIFQRLRILLLSWN